MILNKKIIVMIFLFFSVIIKTETCYAEGDLDKHIYFSIAEAFKIDEVRKDSPADIAGLKAGDHILKIDNEPLDFWATMGSSNLYGEIKESDLFLMLNQSVKQTFDLTVLRENQKIVLKIKPETNSSNQYIIGVSFVVKCPRTRDNQGTEIFWFEDYVFWECWHSIDLKRDNYLRKLKKTSPDFAYFIYEKIMVKRRLSSDHLTLKSVFDIKKAHKYLLDAYNLAKENLNIIKSNYSYAYQVHDAHPSTIAFLLGQVYSNSYPLSRHLYSDISHDTFIDNQKSIKWLTIASNYNHSEALHILGKIYLHGDLDVNKNEKKAFKLINKSTRLGNSEAHKVLAEFYLFGLGGIKKNYSKAILHYKLASVMNLKSSEDYYDILILFKHKRLPKDFKEYYDWLTEDLENSKTISSIKSTADFVNSFLKDYSEAYKWYHICSLNIKSNEWNKNLGGGILGGKYTQHIKRINTHCSKNIVFLEKNLLSEKEIKNARISADKWKKEFIN